jgi:hypothetical protein
MSTFERAQRPALALRVGISGERDLTTEQSAFLVGQLRDVLNLIQTTMDDLSRSDRVRATYSMAERAKSDHSCFMISPLARGADRLAARAGLSLGYSLYVPMPFAKTDYETDFTTEADLAEFRELLGEANGNWLELDGAHGDIANRSYEAVGRLVARQSDILIAIWDGKPERGRGGTADIVRFAAAANTPIIWIESEAERPPHWIAEMLDLTHPLPNHPDYADGLRLHLEKLITPPQFVHPPKVPPFERCILSIKHRTKKHQVHPHEEHFLEEDKPRRWIWGAYAAMMSLLAGPPVPMKLTPAPEAPVPRYWYNRYLPPDRQAGEAADRYRSSYVLVFLAGTLSLVFGATESVIGNGILDAMQAQHASIPIWVKVATLLLSLAEFACLLAILLLVGAVRIHDWHEKSIEYRLLAELYRKQQFLAPLGWSLPFTAVRNLVSDTDDLAQDRAAWVAWLFAAEQRAAPLPTGNLAQTARGLPLTAIKSDLIAGQLAYHESREHRSEWAGGWLALLGIGVFGALFVCAFVKFISGFFGEHTVGTLVLSWLATFLPGVSAAFVGIRAYAELQLLASQSRHVAAALKRAEARVARLDMSRPLASQDLAFEAATVATIMLEDLDGWARLFRLKGAEVA